jgi:predicted ATPase
VIGADEVEGTAGLAMQVAPARDQGKVREASESLELVYGWFTEGFDTRDLTEAKALLDELSAEKVVPLQL